MAQPISTKFGPSYGLVMHCRNISQTSVLPSNGQQIFQMDTTNGKP